MKSLYSVFAVSVLALSAFSQNRSVPVYKDASKPIEERVEDALSRMTVEEKVGLLHAQS